MDSLRRAMPNDATRALWCLIDGEFTAFKVMAPPNIDINDLKQLVSQEKDKGILRDVNAADLALWKVSTLYSPA
jgi:hypothetical protein